MINVVFGGDIKKDNEIKLKIRIVRNNGLFSHDLSYLLHEHLIIPCWSVFYINDVFVYLNYCHGVQNTD